MTAAIVCLLIACLLPLGCAVIAKWGFEGYDNRSPRAWLAAQSGFRASANAAQANSWEALAVFGPAVVLAIAREAPAGWVNGLAVSFVLLRLAFIICYVTGRPTLRSVSWSGGYLVSLALYILAI